MPDGKMDRRMFNCATNKDAIKAYTDWCADMDARILEEMEEKVRPKAKAQQPKEKPAYTEPFKKDEVKEPTWRQRQMRSSTRFTS